MREKRKILFVLFLLSLQILLVLPLISANSLSPATVEGGGSAGSRGGGSGGGHSSNNIIYMSFQSKLYVGQNSNLNLGLENFGDDDYIDITLEVKYRIYGNSNYTLLHSENISTIAANSEVAKVIPFTPITVNKYEFLVTLAYTENNTRKTTTITRYEEVNKGGAELNIGVYTQQGKLYLDSDNAISVYVYNEGNETMINGKYGLYYQEGYCSTRPESASPCNNLILFKEKVINLEENAGIDEIVNFTPSANLEVYTFVLNVSADNLENNQNIYSNRFVVSKNGADLAVLDIIFPESGFITGEKTNISLTITNDGNQDSLDAKYTIYYQEGYCYLESTTNPCNNLVILNTTNFFISSNEEKEFSFDYTPNKTGEVTFLFNITASNDIKQTNTNEFYADVKSTGPDLRPYLASYEYQIIKNNPTIIPITIFNDGNAYTQSSNLRIMIKDRDSFDWTQLSTFNVSGINAKSSITANYSLIIDKKGYYDLRVISSLSGDTYLGNNEEIAIVKSLSTGNDFRISQIENYRPFVLGDNNTIYVKVDNFGTDLEGTAEVKLFEKDTLIGIQIVSPNDDDLTYFDYVPTNNQTKEFRAVVSYAGDVDLTDNYLNVNKSVLDKRRVNLNFEFSNVLPNKFINTYDGFKKIEGNSFPLDLLNGQDEILILLTNATNYFDYYNNDYIILEYQSVKLGNNEKLSFEIYPTIKQNNKETKMVLASNVSFNYSKMYITRQVNTINLGLAGNISNFYCANFSFTKDNCITNWTEQLPLRIYPGNKGRTDMEFSKFNAVGYSYTENFIGLTTNLANSPDVVNNFYLEKVFGVIKFSSPITVTRFRSNPEILSNNIKIEKNLISVNNATPELTNKNAQLTLRDIDMKNPTILRNGIRCVSETCTEIEYNSKTDILQFKVNGFSNYTVIPGEYCGNKVCSSSDGESCSLCSADCGKCPVVAPTDDPIVQTMQTNFCSPRWNCNFGPCIDNAQSLVCTDDNNCGVLDGKPVQARTCPIESNCVDADGDGYGTGPDCVGIDVNDADPANTSPQVENAQKKEVNKTMFYVIVILLLCAIIALSTILIYRYRKDHLSLK